MVKIQTFPGNFEQTMARQMPSTARKTLHRIAREFSQKPNQYTYEKRLEYAHAKLHMQLYQRFGIRSNDFVELAHKALDEILAQRRDSQATTPFRLTYSLQDS